MDTLSEIRLPRLPREQAEWVELQLWWQRVVEQLETAVSSQNTTIAALVATQEDVYGLIAAAGNASEAARRALNFARDVLALVIEAGELNVALEGRINALAAENKKLANNLKNAELLWLH